MAENDSTTKQPQEWPTSKEINEVIDSLRTVRAIGDLLTNMPSDLSFLGEDTLPDIGNTLETLATKALVILRYDNPRSEPQAAAEGGVS